MNKETNTFLLVEDDILLAEAIKINIDSTWTVYHVKSAKEDLPNTNIDVALVDIHLSKTDQKEGLNIIKKIRFQSSETEIIGYSGDLVRQNMEVAIKNGATKFLAKPLAFEELNSILDQVSSFKRLFNIGSKSTKKESFQNWIGDSKESKNILRHIASLKNEKNPILITGETGTGKEVCANLIHSLTPDKNFIPVNLAAIPESLFESQMFGHTKGSFTGAHNDAQGFIGMANNGILFLDEIEALPINLQAKLLRFLETGESQKIGSKQIQKFNTKIITATNICLKSLIDQKLFREDLYWRLSGKLINLPPLRKRKNDIKTLLNYFLVKQSPLYNKSFSNEALALLENYNWPGNIRELKRFVEGITASSPLPIIRSEDVIPWIQKNTSSPNLDSSYKTSILNSDNNLDQKNQSLQDIIGKFEKSILLKRLQKYNDVSEAAASLNISKSSLYQKIKHFNLSNKEF